MNDATKHFGSCYWIGSTKITVQSINEAKEMVEEIQENIEPSAELSNKITDFFFAIEVAYQEFHNLDKDNWDIVH
jgi:hypothetical protein